MPNPVINRRLLAGGGSPVTLFTNLVSYWTLGEATGATRLDSFGTNNLTDLNGDIVQGTGKGGGLSATDACPECAPSASAKLFCASTPGLSGGAGKSFSCTFWSLFTSDFSTSVLLSKYGTLVTNQEYELYIASGGDFFPYWHFLVTNASATAVEIAVNPTGNTALRAFTGAYIFWGWGYDAATDTLWARQGNAGGSAASKQSVGSVGGTQATTQRFLIGNADNTNLRFSGAVQDVAFWSRTITDDEWLRLYNSGAGLPPSNWL